MKTKKLIKKALKNPDNYTEAELIYLRMWREEHKKQKKVHKNNSFK